MGKNHFVYTEEKNFKRDGKVIRFSGMCIGSWLNIEHFMFGMPGPEKLIFDTVSSVFGKETGKEFFEKFRYHFLEEEDFKFLSTCGINLIRVPFNYRLFIDDENPKKFKEEGFYWFDRILEFCRKYEIYLMPDLHSVPGGQNPDWHSDNLTGISQFWQYQVFQNQMIEMWGKIASYYKDEPMILGYDILNEPYLMQEENRLNQFYQKVTDEIRKEDLNHIIFLEGDHFAMDFRKIEKISDSNTAVSFHFYPTVWAPELLTEIYSREERKIRFFQILEEIFKTMEHLQVPALCGEFGYDIDPENSRKAMELLEDTIELLRKNGLSWTVWTYKDVQILGICYPMVSSAWADLARKIKKKWTHYKEMEQAKRIMTELCRLAEFEEADERMKYYMQFRIRGILYQLQMKYILLPEIRNYTKDRFLSLAEDWSFKKCEMYEEYAELLRKKSYYNVRGQ